MGSERGVLIVIPAYNEGARIATVIAGVRQSVPAADVLVIDDGSPDETARRARGAGARVIRLPFNLGYGAALQTGFKYALERGYQVVAQMDGDGQHDPRCLPDLLAVVERGEADVAIGSRFLGSNGYHAPVARRLGMQVFGTIASLIIGQAVTDPTSGFQALNQQVLRLYASEAYPADFPDADVIIMLHLAGFRIREVPVIMYDSATGQSMHAGLKPLYYVFKMFLSILMTLVRERRRQCAVIEGSKA